MQRPSQREQDTLAHNLGVLFVNFGILEHTLSLTIAAAFKLNELQERTFVRGMFARAKVELLNIYAKKHWNDQGQSAMAALSSESLPLIDYRNDFAHGSIFHDENGKWAVITFRGGNRFDGKASPIDVNQLGQRADDIQKLDGSFQKLADDVIAGKMKRPV